MSHCDCHKGKQPSLPSLMTLPLVDGEETREAKLERILAGAEGRVWKASDLARRRTDRICRRARQQSIDLGAPWDVARFAGDLS